MKREPSGVLAWVLLACTSLAMAAVHVTERPLLHELRNAASVPINKYATHEQCVAAAAISPGEYRCVHVTLVSVVGVCDVPPPAPGPVVDADGFTVLGDLEGHLCPGSDSQFYFTETQPTPPEYPTCGRLVPVVVMDCPSTSPMPAEPGFVPPLTP